MGSEMIEDGSEMIEDGVRDQDGVRYDGAPCGLACS